jgi:hypothetical protein
VGHAKQFAPAGLERGGRSRRFYYPPDAWGRVFPDRPPFVVTKQAARRPSGRNQ